MSISIESILAPDRTQALTDCTSKKRALEKVASVVAASFPELDEDNLFKAFISREKLGSTGLGKRAAIPHCRLKEANETIGVLITLQEPIDFESIDGEPVDVIFGLVVPYEAHEEHLNTLAALAERFNTQTFTDSLRRANNDEALYTAATAVTIVT